VPASEVVEIRRLVKLRRLHPDPAELALEDVAGTLDFNERAPESRPYLVLNMVETLDGRISLGGRSGGIGNEADRALFHALRTRADAVMAGAGTVRTERYGRLARAPGRRAAREAVGLAADPLAVVVSARLDLPADLPLLQAPEQRVVVLTASESSLPEVPARVDYLRDEATRAVAGRPALTLAPLLRRLRAEHSVRSIVCEGGPRLNEGLLREGLVDELFLSLAPKVAGGDEPTLVTGPAFDPALELELVWLLEQGNHLFARYRLGKAAQYP